jgi:hypothetical protein
MKYNLPESLKTDRRFETLVKQEMIEHQAIISSHHKEMQALRDALQLSMERFNSLFEYSEAQLKKQFCDFSSQISQIQEKAKNHEALIADQKQTALSLYHDVHQLHDTHASKADVEKVKRDLSSMMQQANIADFNTFQCWQHSVNTVIKSFKGELDALKKDLINGRLEIDKKIDSNFSISMIDKDWVSRKVAAYEKTIFIMEKKIENLYTLIERINKKGEACHKLV